MDAKAVIALLKDTFSEWNEDKAPRLAAALAYYTVFSLAPLLVIVIAVAGLVFGRQAVQGQIVGQIRGLVGDSGANVIQAMIQSTAELKSGIIATVIGIGTLLLGAGGAFGQLRDALNTIWEIGRKPGPPGIKGVIKAIQDNLLSFSMVLGTGFLLLVSLVISVGLTALAKFAQGMFPALAPVMELVNFLVSFGVITLLFAMIYRVLPDAEIAWRDVWLGAAVTSLLFTIGKFLIGLYLGRSSIASAYGAAGSVVLLLVWIYYSAQIFLLGAEFVQVYAQKHGAGSVPAENAVPLTAEKRAQQGIPYAQNVQAATHGQEPQAAQAPSDGAHAGEHLAPQGPIDRLKHGPGLPVLAGFAMGLAIGAAGNLRQLERHRRSDNKGDTSRQPN